MTGRRIGRVLALAALFFSVGCASWCERNCPHTQPVGYGQACVPCYQPTNCCVPAAAPVCCPAPSNYPSQPASATAPPNWSQPRP
jgi:hypothetical protein